MAMSRTLASNLKKCIRQPPQGATRRRTQRELQVEVLGLARAKGNKVLHENARSRHGTSGISLSAAAALTRYLPQRDINVV